MRAFGDEENKKRGRGESQEQWKVESQRRRESRVSGRTGKYTGIR